MGFCLLFNFYVYAWYCNCLNFTFKRLSLCVSVVFKSEAQDRALLVRIQLEACVCKYVRFDFFAFFAAQTPHANQFKHDIQPKTHLQ